MKGYLAEARVPLADRDTAEDHMTVAVARLKEDLGARVKSSAPDAHGLTVVPGERSAMVTLATPATHAGDAARVLCDLICLAAGPEWDLELMSSLGRPGRASALIPEMTVIDQETANHMAELVRRHALDEADAEMLLQALGLSDGQKGPRTGYAYGRERDRSTA